MMAEIYEQKNKERKELVKLDIINFTSSLYLPLLLSSRASSLLTSQIKTLEAEQEKFAQEEVFISLIPRHFLSRLLLSFALDQGLLCAVVPSFTCPTTYQLFRPAPSNFPSSGHQSRCDSKGPTCNHHRSRSKDRGIRGDTQVGCSTSSRYRWLGKLCLGLFHSLSSLVIYFPP